MKINYDIKKRLVLIKYSSLLLLIISSKFIILDKYIVLGSAMLITTLLFEWLCYRCPYCKKSLDSRVSVKENFYCPYCGKKL